MILIAKALGFVEKRDVLSLRSCLKARLNGASKSKISALILAGFVLSGLVFPSRTFAQTTTMTDLGFLPGGNFSLAFGISADGSTIVGQNYTNGVNPVAIRWTQATGMVGIPGSDQGRATGVNADGSVVVGYLFNNYDLAFRWTQANGLVSLGTLPTGTNSYAQAVNADGSIVVGYSTYRVQQGRNVSYPNQAFIWTQAGGMIGLGFLSGGTASQANAVNADGSIIVGQSGSTLGQQAFRMVLTNPTNGTGTMTGLGFLTGGSSSQAFGVNADGSVVVGQSDSSSSGQQAFRWVLTNAQTGAGTMTGLGFLQGGTTSQANGVNADGSVVVGYSGNLLMGTNYQGFRWTQATGMVGLGFLTGGTFSRAQAVSADGSVVVGFGTYADGSGVAIVWRILTPSSGTTTSLAPATSSSPTIVTKAIDLTNTYAAMGGTIQNAGSFTASRGAQMAGLGGGGVAGGACFDCFSEALISAPATGSASFYDDLSKAQSANASATNPLATMQAIAPDVAKTNIGTKSASIAQLTGAGASNSYLSFGARYLNGGKFTEGAGTLRGGYRLTDSIIAHAFIDYAGNIRAPAYYKPKDASPTLGGGLSWYQNTSGLGAQASVFGAWQHERVTITRVALANTEAGVGTAGVTSKMFGGELGYGFAPLKDVTATPYVGLRYVSVNRGAYSEALDMNTTFPIAYNPLGQRQVTATFGTRASWAVMPNLKLHATLGGEYDVVQKLAALSGTSLIPGLTSFSATATGPKNRLRPVVGLGVTFEIAKNQYISADTFAQTQIYTNAIAFGASVAYRLGF